MAIVWGMPDRFTASVLAVEELPDLNTFLIALTDQEEDPTRIIELQRALEPEEDGEQDFDSYCLVLDQGATHYGGMTACILNERQLELRLDDPAAEVFETDGFEITLDLSDLDQARLAMGLQRLFLGDRLAPTELILPGPTAGSGEL